MSGSAPIENLLYHLAISTYAKAVDIAAYKNPQARFLAKGQREVWEKLEAIGANDRVVWFHAASLGEFEQARPLIERLRLSNPEFKVLLTFFSPSGYEIRKNYSEADWVCYLPFDTPQNARRFVKTAHPEFAIFIKYEIWRNYLLELRNADIPAYLVSAAFRPGQAFFRPYGVKYREWLRLFSAIYVQDENSRLLLDSIGITGSVVAGDTRFDRVTDIMKQRKELPEIQKFINPLRQNGKIVMVVGSSWQPDEEVYIPWLSRHSEVAAIIAPHEFDSERLRKLLDRFNGEAVLHSELLRNPDAGEGKHILIIDCFGLLSSIYRFADLAYVGGGFGVGIHNINEAAVYGIPVLFGPNYHRFIEAEELIAHEGAFSISGKEDFDTKASALLEAAPREKMGRNAGEYIHSKLGASDAIARALFPKHS